MRLLALDTSTLAGGVALAEGERTVGAYVLDVRATHSERLLAAVDRLLGDAGWAPHDLDGLAVAVGPGSFTGLRIGLATAKGLALALSLPVAAVPTLDAMAAALPYASLPVCPVLDARKGEVYTSLYRWDGLDMRREWEYLAVAPEVLADRLREPVIVLGPRAVAIPSPLARSAPPQCRVPAAICLAHLGLRRLRAGQTVAAADLAPLYLRSSEAEVRRRAAALR
jgi:tRNA threonylcarbamoyladenosine biosynthesis protein TsaB